MGNTAYYGKELLKVQFAYEKEHGFFDNSAEKLKSDIDAMSVGTLYDLDLIEIAIDLLGFPPQCEFDDYGNAIGYPFYINREYFHDAWHKLKSVDKFMDFCKNELTEILGETQ